MNIVTILPFMLPSMINYCTRLRYHVDVTLYYVTLYIVTMGVLVVLGTSTSPSSHHTKEQIKVEFQFLYSCQFQNIQSAIYLLSAFYISICLSAVCYLSVYLLSAI